MGSSTRTERNTIAWNVQRQISRWPALFPLHHLRGLVPALLGQGLGNSPRLRSIPSGKIVVEARSVPLWIRTRPALNDSPRCATLLPPPKPAYSVVLLTMNRPNDSIPYVRLLLLRMSSNACYYDT